MLRVLIANRGEIASRIARTLRKLNLHSLGIATLWDTNLPYVHDLDSVHYEPTHDISGVFLNPHYLLDLARKYGCSAVHPGYGFLSENAEFARLCEDNGIVFIGPPTDAISQLGSKIFLKQVCKKHGVPTLEELDPTAPDIESHLPIIIKGSDSGGGRGMRVIRQLEDLQTAIESARGELRAFGGGTLFAEKYLENVKHIEVQVIVDHKGNAFALLERDCSVQRKFQKVIEESPSPGINPEIRVKILDSALKIASSLGFPSLYTYEFLVSSDSFYLSEVNTRLQVEHTVTEEIYDIDLVEIQTRIAFQEQIRASYSPIHGHSIQLRLYAEDPATFTPAAGYIRRLNFGIKPSRLETTYQEGCSVAPVYDPLICKIIQTGNCRQSVINKLIEVLISLSVVGVETNKDLLLWALRNEPFQRGDYFTSLILNFKYSSESDCKSADHVHVLDAVEQSVHQSPILGTIAKILVNSGKVEKGQTVLLIESMKIQHPIFSTKSGALNLLVKEGDVVKKGDVLFHIE